MMCLGNHEIKSFPSLYNPGVWKFLFVAFCFNLPMKDKSFVEERETVDGLVLFAIKSTNA